MFKFRREKFHTERRGKTQTTQKVRASQADSDPTQMLELSDEEFKMLGINAERPSRRNETACKRRRATAAEAWELRKGSNGNHSNGEHGSENRRTCRRRISQQRPSYLKTTRKKNEPQQERKQNRIFQDCVAISKRDTRRTKERMENKY